MSWPMYHLPGIFFVMISSHVMANLPKATIYHLETRQRTSISEVSKNHAKILFLSQDCSFCNSLWSSVHRDCPELLSQVTWIFVGDLAKLKEQFQLPVEMSNSAYFTHSSHLKTLATPSLYQDQKLLKKGGIQCQDLKI